MKVTLRRVHKTTVGVVKQEVLNILRVSVALVIPHAKSMRRIISSTVACLAVSYFSHFFHKWHDFRRKKCY